MDESSLTHRYHVCYRKRISSPWAVRTHAKAFLLCSEQKNVGWLKGLVNMLARSGTLVYDVLLKAYTNAKALR